MRRADRVSRMDGVDPQAGVPDELDPLRRPARTAHGPSLIEIQRLRRDEAQGVVDRITLGSEVLASHGDSACTTTGRGNSQVCSKVLR